MRKLVTFGVVLLLLTIGVTGCGKSTNAKIEEDTAKEIQQDVLTGEPNKQQNTTAQTRELSPEVKLEQDFVHSLDTKTQQGRQAVDTKIDEKLKSLDSSLDKLDKSMGDIGALQF